MEEYRDVVNYEGLYQVSNLGRVKSLARYRVPKDRILKAAKDNLGYYGVTLCDNSRIQRRIHQLVAESFLGFVRDGTHKIVVDHINNIKTDNRLENLQLCSTRENLSKDLKGCSSKYVGVCFHTRDNVWNARIQTNGESKWLGTFKAELEAAEAYQIALKQLNKY